MIPNDWSPTATWFSDQPEGLPFLSVYSAADRSVTPFAPGAKRSSPRWKMDCLCWPGRCGRRRRHHSSAVSRSGPTYPHLRRRRRAAAMEPRWQRAFLHCARPETHGGPLRPQPRNCSIPRTVFQTRIIAQIWSLPIRRRADGRFLINSFLQHLSLTMITGWQMAH